MIHKKSLVDHPDFKSGEVILIDKEIGWTSFDVVSSLRNYIRRNFSFTKTKVGHAGTLDPLATGLVIICTGKKTKEIESYQTQEKEYTGSFFIGKTTPSFDLETEPGQDFPTDHITGELVLEATKNFTGTIEQEPPVFSAVKIDGKKAYEYARKKKEVKMRKRLVEIFDFEITEIKMPEVFFKVRCSKGTYIRSLANDYGKALDSGAYLASLRRTAIGDFHVDDAYTVREFKTAYQQGSNEDRQAV